MEYLREALLREEHWAAVGRPQEGGSLAAQQREVAPEYSLGARAGDCSPVASQPPVVPR